MKMLRHFALGNFQRILNFSYDYCFIIVDKLSHNVLLNQNELKLSCHCEYSANAN